MGARILHVSDLHSGAREDPDLERALCDLGQRVAPDLLVASGDLTHRARREQQERAADVLRSVGAPVLVVPGNHDIPWALSRVTSPFAEFDRVWETREPVFRSERLHVVGLDSVRPWRHQSGGIRAGALARAQARLAEAPMTALRVAVLHHQLLGAPWRTRKRPLARRGSVLHALAAAGAELILSGHVHQAATSEWREFEIVGDETQAVVVSTAPGLGRPRPSRLGEARGAQVYEADEDTLRTSTYVWRGDGWTQVAARSFPRGRSFGQSSP